MINWRFGGKWLLVSLTFNIGIDFVKHLWKKNTTLYIYFIRFSKCFFKQYVKKRRKRNFWVSIQILYRHYRKLEDSEYLTKRRNQESRTSIKPNLTLHVIIITRNKMFQRSMFYICVITTTLKGLKMFFKTYSRMKHSQILL